MNSNPTASAGPSGEKELDLFKVLQENFSHARHQENLRERQNNVYWVMWGALLSFVYSKQGNVGEYPLLFVFLFVVSIAVLLSTLKWTAEYGNHVAAVAIIAQRLGLNAPVTNPVATAKGRSPLPFVEFTGVMALPLRFPIALTVGAWMCGAHSFGIAAAAGLAVYGFTARSWQPYTSLLAWLAFFLVLIVAFAACASMFRRMNTEIKLRTAEVGVSGLGSR